MPVGLNDKGQIVNFANKCTKCGWHMPLPENAGKHCLNCGTKVDASPIALTPKPEQNCLACGATVGSHDKFCSNCGKTLY
jgi:predicted RNA-binding Zn-ribbon protein involved in translation (DUF1610 family)